MIHLQTFITWVFAAIGFVTSVVQIWKWVRGRKADRGFEIFLESQVDRKDAEATRVKLSELEENLSDLKAVARSIARRIHLEQRKEDLEKTLGSSWIEYEGIINELGRPAPTPGLPPELLDALVSDIGPRHVAERKEIRRNNRLLLVLAAALLLPLPFTPQSVVYLAATLLAGAAIIPPGAGEVAYICGPILTVLFIFLGILAGVFIEKRRQIDISGRSSRVLALAAGALLVIGNGIAGWAVFNSLYWETGNFHLAIGFNIADCLIAAFVGIVIIVGRLVPTDLLREFSPRNSSPLN
jgi:hypothetical protein